MRPASIAVCAVLAAPAVAQQRAAEFAALEEVLRAAIDRAAPSVVLVETFGGVRKVLAGGAEDADAPKAAPEPRPAEPPKGEPPEGAPPADPPEADPPEGERKPPVGPLRQPGFLQAQGATTGIVVSADGWILVSRFALNFDPSTILVTTADGRSFHARRAGEDTSRGIALVKIDTTGLPVPEFVPAAAVRVGQWAFALGRTFGRADPSVHMGVVSALGRQFGRALQTDAATSPANYGGPLIDIEGRVLGVCVPLSRSGRDAGVELYDSGIGFATTLADLEPVLARMRAGEELHRGWLGVTSAPHDFGPGALIAAVMPGSRAESIGLRAGDRIASVDGVALRNGFHLQNLVSARMAGDAVDLVLVRELRALRARVTLAPIPAAEREAKKPSEEAFELPWEQGQPDGDRR